MVARPANNSADSRAATRGRPYGTSSEHDGGASLEEKSMSIDPEKAVGVRAKLFGQLTSENRTTLSVIEHALDDKLDFTPHPKLRPFGPLALHIYQTGIWFVNIMESGKVEPSGTGKKPVSPRKKNDLIARCEGLNREVANRVNALTPESLARLIEFPGVGPFPTVTYLGWHVNHMIHHRGQLTVYLRLMGAKVPPVYGPTLDYP